MVRREVSKRQLAAAPDRPGTFIMRLCTCIWRHFLCSSQHLILCTWHTINLPGKRIPIPTLAFLPPHLPLYPPPRLSWNIEKHTSYETLIFLKLFYCLRSCFFEFLLEYRKHTSYETLLFLNLFSCLRSRFFEFLRGFVCGLFYTRQILL